jgi:hypothetical protein
VILLYEFPDRYTPTAEASAGAVDGVTWLTANEVGAEGTPVPIGAALHVRGWAANLDVTGPATQVIVSVDGRHKHHARLGGSRPDVARHFGNDSLTTSGFEAIVTTGRLAPGEHEIVAYSVDAQSRRYARISQSMPFTIVADWKAVPAEMQTSKTVCAGSLDEVRDESRGIALVPVDGVLAIPRGVRLSLRGWFCNPGATTAFRGGYAIIDDERAYPLEYGLSRPDVAGSFDGPVPSDVGFSVEIPTITLKRGEHQLKIVGAGSDADAVFMTPISLQLLVGPSASARITLNEMTAAFLDDVVRIKRGVAREVGAPLRVVRGDRLFVRGWAFDEAARGVAAGVALMIDGRLEVPALYGLPRPDVAEAHQNEGLVRSGFTAEIDTDDLAAGLHTADCRVLSRDGRGAYATAQRFEFEVLEVNES